MSTDDLSHLSMQELFRVEMDNQTRVLIAGLLALERDPGAADPLEACMRAAHSLKGAARIVDLSSGVGVAHAMEDCFVAAQQGRLRLGQRHIDLLLNGVDLLGHVAGTTEGDRGQAAERDKPEIDAFLLALSLALQTGEETAPIHDDARPAAALDGARAVEPVAARETEDRVLRVTAENLNRLLGLAGESLVASRWLKPFADSLLRLKRQQHDSAQSARRATRCRCRRIVLDERAQTALDEVRRRVLEGEQSVGAMAHRSGDIRPAFRRSLQSALR